MFNARLRRPSVGTSSFFGIGLVLLLGALRPVHAEVVAQAIVQDFEHPFSITKWPPNKPGEITFSGEWKEDGAKALRIDPGLMAALGTLKLKNWNGYTQLRFRVNNTSERAASIRFELQDRHTHFHERHQNAFGVRAGISTVEMDISGKLWRGEENKPYRGRIKSPIETSGITRLSFANNGDAPIYIDRIEVIKEKKISVEGAFAFDFGKAGSQVMSQCLGIFHQTGYNAAKGYGLNGSASGLSKNMSFPTPLLGDSVKLGGNFQVDLPGGAYLGWVAFERGGFWGDEYSGYSKATLAVNGKAAHEHTFATDGAHFHFQDTEIISSSDLMEKLIWPAHAIHRFKFTADKGKNLFTVKTQDAVSYPLRIAGLILAPDHAAGKAFIDNHVKRQRKCIKRTFAFADKGRRGAERIQPAEPLVVHPMQAGAAVYPSDWPLKKKPDASPEILAVQGQQVAVQLAVYAQKKIDVNIEAAPLKQGTNELKATRLSHGRYMPMRNYGVGTAWVEINHFRPEPNFSAGPDLARAALVEYRIGKDTPPGIYQGSIAITGNGHKVRQAVRIKVLDIKLETIPIPVGLFMNAIRVPQNFMDAKAWWKLQESVVKEQMQAGLTALSGGPGLVYKVVSKGNGLAFQGDAPIKYIRMAQKYGTVHAIVPYGGFIPNIKRNRHDPNAFAEGLKAMEKKHQLPPHFVYAYDEPGTASEKQRVMNHTSRFTAAGCRTIGYTSWHGNDPLWNKLVENSYAPAMNLHKGEHLKEIKRRGKHPWVYNNGLNRLGMGLRIWRSIQYGNEGRMEWIGLFSQGFAFHNLDGREPSRCCFLVHKELGMLTTLNWLSVREGLLDLRIRLTLEKHAPRNDPALTLWTKEGYKQDEREWTAARMDDVRRKMLTSLEKLK